MTAEFLRDGSRRQAWLLTAAWAAAGVGNVLHAGADKPPGDIPPVRLGVSESVVRGVSVNDARAALAVWSAEIGRASGISLAMQDPVLPTGQLLAAIRSGTIDVFCITVQEYRQIVPYVDISRILVDDYGGDELVLAVREESGITNLRALRGRSMILFDNPHCTLAEPWLTVLLWREVQCSPPQWLGRISVSSRLSQVVLPVFFGQADACVVTRGALETMFELNPQLSKKLRVLQSSPKLVGVFFACRKNSVSRKRILDRLFDARTSPAAKQVLMLFQSHGIALRDGEYLRSAIDILDAYERHEKKR